MIIEVRCLPNGNLVANTEDAKKRLKKIKAGSVVLMDYKAKRNVQFHRKLFSLLKLVFTNQDHYKTIDNILEIVKFRAGHFETIVTHKGKKHYKTKSIAFSEMDNEEFEDFYSRAIDVALEITELTKENIENEILRYL